VAQQLLGALLVPLGAPDHGQVVEAAHLPHAVLTAALEGAHGLFHLVAPFVDDAHVVVGHEVLGGQGHGLLEVLQGVVQLAGVVVGEAQPVVGGLVMGVDLQTGGEGADRLGHVAPVIPGHPQVVVAEEELRRPLQGLAVALDGQIQGALVKVEVAQQMVAQHVAGLDLHQPFQLLARLAAAPVALVHQRQEQALIDEGVAEKHPALGTELVSLAGLAPAAGAALDASGVAVGHP